MTKIYLAGPYSSNDIEIKIRRFSLLNTMAAKLMNKGHLVFSPISHTHPIAMAGNLPGGWEFWKEYDRTFIEWADEIHVLKLPGWAESTGVSAEIALAIEMDKPVTYIEVEELFDDNK